MARVEIEDHDDETTIGTMAEGSLVEMSGNVFLVVAVPKQFVQEDQRWAVSLTTGVMHHFPVTQHCVYISPDTSLRLRNEIP